MDLGVSPVQMLPRGRVALFVVVPRGQEARPDSGQGEVMTHGERAEAKSNRRDDYGGRRAGNNGWANPRGSVRRGLSPKTITHRTERRRLNLSLAVALFSVLVSCAALRSAGWTGGGAAAGALAGSTMGPGGAAVGAGVGAVAASTLSENDELRDGGLVGQGALDDQVARWKGEAVRSGARADWLGSLMRWLAIAGCVYFAFRNRAHLLEFARTRDWRVLVHAVFGGRSAPRAAQTPDSEHGDRDRG